MKKLISLALSFGLLASTAVLAQEKEPSGDARVVKQVVKEIVTKDNPVKAGVTIFFTPAEISKKQGEVPKTPPPPKASNHGRGARTAK